MELIRGWIDGKDCVKNSLRYSAENGEMIINNDSGDRFEYL